MRDIKVCPSLLIDGNSDYSKKAIQTLFGGLKATCHLNFVFDDDLGSGYDASMIDASVESVNMIASDYLASTNNISISGAQEKYPGVLDNGIIRIAREDEYSMFIIKPAPLDRILLRKQIPANEHLTMQIASQVYGIETALNGLCFDKKGQPVYLTRRFDKTDKGERYLMEDFASLIGKNESNAGEEYKYDGSYDDIAKCIRKLIPAWRIAMERFMRLVVFNYIYANGDAHLKNFSVIRRGNDVMLAPAYDLINTAIHINGDDIGLKGGLSPEIEKSDVYGRTGHPCRLDFKRFGIHIGLAEKRVDKILDEFISFPNKVDYMIEHSFFHEDRVRRTYKRIIEQRRQRFIRESE